MALTTNNKQKTANAGFSLVEMIVSVGLFAVVMLISMSALLALLGANTKARSLELVMNNLNIALDGMVRAVRMGTVYHCGSGDVSVPKNCTADPEEQFSFLRFGGDAGDPNDYWIYYFENGRLYKKTDANSTEVPVTSPEIDITNMKFYIDGAEPDGSGQSDTIQPKIVILISGTAGTDVRARTSFSVQATAVQRSLDI